MFSLTGHPFAVTGTNYDLPFTLLSQKGLTQNGRALCGGWYKMGIIGVREQTAAGERGTGRVRDHAGGFPVLIPPGLTEARPPDVRGSSRCREGTG